MQNSEVHLYGAINKLINPIIVILTLHKIIATKI